MAFIIALFIVLFKIAALIFFCYAFYLAKGWLRKTIIFISFLFYCSLYLPIFIMRLGDSYGNSNRHRSDSGFISEVENNLEKTQLFLGTIPGLVMEGLKQILPHGPLAAIFFLILFAPILTFSFSHFILNFVYFMFFGLLWTVFLRPKIEVPNVAISADNLDGHQGKDSSPVNKDGLLLSLLKWLFKK